MGGLVKYVTVDPSTTDISGRAEAGLNIISHGSGLGYTLRAGLNVPLSETLAVRVSGFNRKDPGYIDNVTTGRSEEHTSELQSLMRTSYAVFCLKKQTNNL